MKQKELMKTFMMISNWKNPFGFLVWTSIYFSALKIMSNMGITVLAYIIRPLEHIKAFPSRRMGLTQCWCNVGHRLRRLFNIIPAFVTGSCSLRWSYSANEPLSYEAPSDLCGDQIHQRFRNKEYPYSPDTIWTVHRSDVNPLTAGAAYIRVLIFY